MNKQINKNFKDEYLDSSSKYNTPLRNDAFEITDHEKIKGIELHFYKIMEILGLDLKDDSLSNTPKRIAKMFVKDIFSGLNPSNFPRSSTFKNKYKYNQMLVEKNIEVYSTCEHHFLPMVGYAHVGYISNGRVIGISKINRIVNYFSKRPQVQERLTMQIVRSIQNILHTKDVACIVDVKHLCVNSRGIHDTKSSTVTSEFEGIFKINSNIRMEFLHYTID